MPELHLLTPPELADLLQQAYAADYDEPGEHLTDPDVRTLLATVLDKDDELKAAVIEAWLEDREALEDELMYWFDAEFLAELELPDREEN